MSPFDILTLAQAWLEAGDALDKVGMDVELGDATPADERASAAAWLDACGALRDAVRTFQDEQAAAEADPVEAFYVRVRGQHIAMTQKQYETWRQGEGAPHGPRCSVCTRPDD